MATIINNPGTSDNNSGDSGAGILIGVIVVIVLIVLFMIYGLPAFRTSTIPPDTNINVTVPTPTLPTTPNSPSNTQL